MKEIPKVAKTSSSKDTHIVFIVTKRTFAVSRKKGENIDPMCNWSPVSLRLFVMRKDACCLKDVDTIWEDPELLQRSWFSSKCRQSHLLLQINFCDFTGTCVLAWLARRSLRVFHCWNDVLTLNKRRVWPGEGSVACAIYTLHISLIWLVHSFTLNRQNFPSRFRSYVRRHCWRKESRVLQQCWRFCLQPRWVSHWDSPPEHFYKETLWSAGFVYICRFVLLQQWQ